MIKITKRGLILKLKVQPGASRNEIVGVWLDSLKVRVTAQPEAGKANKACIDLLAKQLGVPKGNIEIVKGHTKREKQINIIGFPQKDLIDRLKLTPLEKGHV